MENYYEILGVSQSATDDQIKKAYLKQIKIYHPDVYQGEKVFAEERTRQITEAYTVLKGYLTRKGYDEKLKQQTKENNPNKSTSTSNEQSDTNTEKSETKENDEKSHEKEYNPNFGDNAYENVKKEKKQKTKKSDKKSKDYKDNQDNKEEKQENAQEVQDELKNKNLEASREPLSKSELKDKKILNIIIITLMVLLILSIIMTFITIH